MLSIIGVVLLLVVAWGDYLYANRSTPTKTLNTLCDALKSHDYQTAYNQYLSSFVRESEMQYASSEENYFGSFGGIVNCTVSNVNENGSSAIAVIILTYGNGRAVRNNMTLTNKSGVWKIG